MLRRGAEMLYQALIGAELTERIGAERFERSDSRLTQRNGHRERTFSTKAGDLELKIPKLREGSFFPSLLERRRRVDRALFAVVMEPYVHGVSTRKVDDLVRALGVDAGLSKSEVSRICGDSDEEMSAFRGRDLSAVEFPYVFLDATYLKARVDHQVVSRAVAVAANIRLLRKWATRVGPTSDPLRVPFPADHGFEELDENGQICPAGPFDFDDPPDDLAA